MLRDLEDRENVSSLGARQATRATKQKYASHSLQGFSFYRQTVFGSIWNNYMLVKPESSWILLIAIVMREMSFPFWQKILSAKIKDYTNSLYIIKEKQPAKPLQPMSGDFRSRTMSTLSTLLEFLHFGFEILYWKKELLK